jgi:hypothetical protein
MKKFFYSLFDKSDFFRSIVATVSERLYQDMRLSYFENRLIELDRKYFLLSSSAYVVEISPSVFEKLRKISENFNMDVLTTVEYLIEKQSIFLEIDDSKKEVL